MKAKKHVWLHMFIFLMNGLYGMEPDSTHKSQSMTLATTRHYIIPIHCEHDLFIALAPYLNTSAQPGTVVALWDLDCTVGVLDDLRLHPSIFDFNVELVRRLQPSTTTMDPFDMVMADLRKLYENAQMRPMESANRISKIISLLQARNIPNFGITARSTPLKQATMHQLVSNLNIKFSHLSSITQSPMSAEIIFRRSPPAKAYEDGICCCGINSKGIISKELFNALGIDPETIIIADDGRKNLDSFLIAHPHQKVIALHMQIPNMPDTDHFREILAQDGIDINEIVMIGSTSYFRWQLYPSALALARTGPVGGSEMDLHALASLSPGSSSPVSCRGRFEGDAFGSNSPTPLQHPPQR